MIHASWCALATLAASLGVENTAVVPASPDTVTIVHCFVSLAAEAQVPAMEAGQLVDVPVVAGQNVPKAFIMAQIDDLRPRTEHRAASLKLEVDKAKATNDVNLRYAEKGAEVALYAYKRKKEACDKVPGSVSETELKQSYLEYEKFVLQAEQSQRDMLVAGLEARVREAEVDAALENLERRKIRSPLDGVVVEVKKHTGEWVQAGETVVRVLRMDRLWIEGFLKDAQHNPGEIADRRVTISVDLARGRKESFQGRVVFVSPQVEANGEFRIRAEVLNRAENEHWMLRPGHTAEMTVHLK